MNTHSDAAPDPPPEVHTIAAMAAARPLYWSVRRELWENPSTYIAPLAAAGVFLFGFSLSTIGLPHRMRALSALDPAKQHAVVVMPYSIAATLIILTAYLVGAFYCVDALHGERRERSILFWKSLPVSDLTTVVSKASIPLLVLLWAVLPPLAIAVLESLVFRTSHFASWVKYRLIGTMKVAFAWEGHKDGDIDRLAQLTPARFLSTPGLWIGLVAAAALLAAAARLRRSREPI